MIKYKSILITGGTGSFGKSFVKHILKKKNNIKRLVIFSRDEWKQSEMAKIFPPSKYPMIRFFIGDVRDSERVKRAFKNIDLVVHAAALKQVPAAEYNPIEFINTNIIGTFNLLQASRTYINKNNFKFIHVSTDEVYGDLGLDGYFDEDSSYRPNSPYSASKAASDHLVRSWGRTFNLPVIITNCSNNYGAYQFPEKLIPLMIINCLDWKQLPVYGNGENIRDWLFVKDHCTALEIIFSEGEIGETYNIGSSNEVKNIDIVKAICDTMDELKPSINGSYRQLISFVADRPGHDKRYAVDSTKLNNTLKWEPKESFSTGIKKTIDWYINNEKWWRKIQQNNYNQQRLGLKDK